MNDDPRGWIVRITDIAQEDFRDIVRWSRQRFGEPQARAYASMVSAALRQLRAGPTAAGARKRHDIGKGLLTLHVGRRGRRARHFIVFRVADERERILEVLRLLHDAMDAPRHVSSDPTE